MSGAVYERELKRLLEGNREAVSKYIAQSGLSGALAKAVEYQVRHPFYVVRSAGSKSMDLLAIRGRVVLPFEIKSTASEVVNFTDANGRNQRQYEGLIKDVKASGLMLFYAVRLKNAVGEGWRVFAGFEARGWLWVPVVGRSSSGNVVLRFSEGMTLSEFLKEVRGSG